MKSAESTAVTDRVLKEHEFESHFSFDIRPHVRVTEYEKGEYIIRNTDQLTRILYLVQGTAKLYGFRRSASSAYRSCLRRTNAPIPWWHRRDAALSRSTQRAAAPDFCRMHSF